MLKGKIEELSFDKVRQIKVSDIVFEPTLIDLCRMNHCGNYEKNYTCPPLVGDTEALIKRASSYADAIIFQKIFRIEDSFDIEGMQNAAAEFNQLVQRVNDICRTLSPDILVLGAGGCRLCERCGAVDSIPCRFPDKALTSPEAYGINVSKLAQICGMNYINGQNTVTYFGGVLY